MASLTPQIMLAFQDELEKQAVDVRALLGGARQFMARQGTTAGSGAALGGLVGGGAGAVGGAGHGYLKARQEGGTRGEATSKALKGAWKGLKGGAMLGAGAGAAGGLAGGARARGLASKLRGKEDILGKASRFGERQVHGLTGYVPRDAAGKAVGGGHVEALRAMRGGAHMPASRIKDLEEAYRAAPAGKASDKALKSLKAGRAHLKAGEAAEEMGITSLPGYLKGLAGKGKFVAGTREGQRVGGMEALKTGLKEQWASTGTGPGGAAMKGLVFGLPAAGAASEAMRPSKAGEEGRLTRAGRSLGGLAYGMAPLPLAGMSALASGLERGGALAGKGIQKATGMGGGPVDTETVRKQKRRIHNQTASRVKARL